MPRMGGRIASGVGGRIASGVAATDGKQRAEAEGAIATPGWGEGQGEG
jgi:hypothetical protein